MENPQGSSILRKDLVYPFAIVLVLLIFFDISRGVVGASILALTLLEIVGGAQLTTSALLPLVNLFLILSAQIGAILFFSFLARKRIIEPDDVEMPTGNHWRSLYFVYTLLMLFLVAGIPIIDRILQTQLGSTIEEAYQISTSGVSPTLELVANPLYPILYLTVIILGASIAEELIFRRTMIPLLERRGFGTFWILILSSLLYSIIHSPLDLLQNSLHYTIIHFLSIFASGMAFGFIYLRTRHVLYPIVLHGISNGFLAISSLALEANDQFVISLAGYWLLIGIIIGFLVLVGVMMQVDRFWDATQHQPLWLQILKDVNLRRSHLLPVIWLILVFAIIEGGRTIVINVTHSFLMQIGFHFDYLEMVIQVVLLLPLMGIVSFFIFRVGAPLQIPDSVSSKKGKQKTSELKLVCGECDSPQLTSSAEFCGNCGNPLEEK